MSRIFKLVIKYFFCFKGYSFKSVGFLCKVRGNGFVIGKNVVISDFCWLEAVNSYKTEKKIQRFNPELILHDNVAMSDFVHISAVKKIEIGEGTLIGSKVYIGDHSHGSYKQEKWRELANISPRYRPLDDIEEVIVGKNCWIGDGVVILAGTVLGDNCVIGANSVVKGKFDSNQIIAGIPAKVVRSL